MKINLIISFVSLIYWTIIGGVFFYQEEDSIQKRLSLSIFIIIILVSIISIVINQNLQPINLIFFASLFIVGIYDFFERTIPNFASYYLIPILILNSQSKSEAFVCGLLTWSIFKLIGFLYLKQSGVDGIGDGDAPFAAMIAVFVLSEAIGPVLCLSSILGIIFSVIFQQNQIPFGTMLSAATIILWQMAGLI
jgi:Flp pilus assembly protein protease CpaA